MRSDKRSQFTINIELITSWPVRGLMKKLTWVHSILNVLHKYLSSVGAFVDFEALCDVEVTPQMFFALSFLAEITF